MKCVTYNIQYGVGLDGKYELERIVEAVRGAEVICLQEVSRNNPMNRGVDMVAAIQAALPDYYAVFGSNFDANVGSWLGKDGRARTVMFQLGNMILSKSPIHLSRNLLLPRNRSFDVMNFQRGALEALINTPLGFIRFYSTHLDHRSPQERLAQVAFLKERVLQAPLEGMALSGMSESGFPEPPVPEEFIVMGDFNMLEGSPEYAELCGAPDHEFGQPLLARMFVDQAARLYKPGERPTTWVDPGEPENAARWKRIDYVFTSASMAKRGKRLWVDAGAVGSDHQPLWVEFA